MKDCNATETRRNYDKFKRISKRGLKVTQALVDVLVSKCDRISKRGLKECLRAWDPDRGPGARISKRGLKVLDDVGRRMASYANTRISKRGLKDNRYLEVKYPNGIRANLKKRIESAQFPLEPAVQ